MIHDPLTIGARYTPESVSDVAREVRLVGDLIEVLDPQVEFELLDGQILIGVPDFAFPPQTIGAAPLAGSPVFGTPSVT